MNLLWFYESSIWESNRALSGYLLRDRMHYSIILLATYLLRRAREGFTNCFKKVTNSLHIKIVLKLLQVAN